MSALTIQARIDFVRYNTQQTKTYLIARIESLTKKTVKLGHYHTNGELAEMFADAMGYPMHVPLQDEVEEVETSDLPETTLSATLGQLIAHKAEKTATARTETDTKIQTLLAEMVKATDKNEKKKIRTALRKLGYRLSDNR